MLTLPVYLSTLLSLVLLFFTVQSSENVYNDEQIEHNIVFKCEDMFVSNKGTICPVSAQQYDGDCIIPFRQGSALVNPIDSCCMAQYVSQTVDTKLKLVDEFNITRFFWFDPIPEFRIQKRLFLIQAVGPLFKVPTKVIQPNQSKNVSSCYYNVLPVWLRNGQIVPFYQPGQDCTVAKTQWKPVLSLGSTTEECPFIDNSENLGNCFGYNKWVVPYNTDYAGSIMLERAAHEVIAIEDSLPSQGELIDWKQLFELLGYRSWGQEESHKIHISSNMDQLHNYRSYVVSYKVITQAILPKINDNVSSRAYNVLGVVTKATVGFNFKVTHGSYPSNYPGLFHMSHADAVINHVLLIPDADRQIRGKLIFDEIFETLIRFLHDPMLRDLADPPESQIGLPVLTDCSIFKTDTLEHFKKFDKSPGAQMLQISHNPITDLVILEMTAEQFVAACPKQSGACIAAEIIYTRMAHRASVILTTDISKWIHNKNFHEMTKNSLIAVRAKFVEDNREFLPKETTGDNLSRNDIFKVFALRCCIG